MGMWIDPAIPQLKVGCSTIIDLLDQVNVSLTELLILAILCMAVHGHTKGFNDLGYGGTASTGCAKDYDAGH